MERCTYLTWMWTMNAQYLPSCYSPCRVLCMRPAACPHWRSAQLSWGQRAYDREGRGVRSPEDMAADTPHRTWTQTTDSRGVKVNFLNSDGNDGGASTAFSLSCPRFILEVWTLLYICFSKVFCYNKDGVPQHRNLILLDNLIIIEQSSKSTKVMIIYIFISSINYYSTWINKSITCQKVIRR